VAPQVTACKQAQFLLEKAQKAGDFRGMATALTDLGVVTVENGNAQNAILFLEAALKLAKRLGDPAVEADVLHYLGKAARAAGQADRAALYLNWALAIARQLGDHFGEKLTLEQLAKLYASQGDALRTIVAYEQAIALARKVGHAQHEADLTWTLAIHHADAGRRDQALCLAQSALHCFVESGHPGVRLLSASPGAISAGRRIALASSSRGRSGTGNRARSPGSELTADGVFGSQVDGQVRRFRPENRPARNSAKAS
jgi:hypothetical protein